MASKNKGGRGNVHYTGKRKYKYVHYIRYIIRKCLRLNLHINGILMVVGPLCGQIIQYMYIILIVLIVTVTLTINTRHRISIQ